MRMLLHSLCMVVGLGCAGMESQARSFGMADEALFVSATALATDGGAPHALCHHARTFRLAGIPFYRGSVGPVLSPVECNVATMIPLTTAQLTGGLPGVRDWIVEKSTGLTFAQRIEGIWGWFLVPLFVVPIWVARAFSRKETAGRAVLLQTVDPYTRILSQMLGLVAGANGRLKRQQFARIRAIVSQKTGEDVSQEEVLELAEPAAGPLGDVSLGDLRDELSLNQRIGVADAVQQIIAETPDVSDDVHTFAERLFDALGIPGSAQRPNQNGGAPEVALFGSHAPAE